MPSDDDVPPINRSRLRWDTSPASLLGQGSFGIVYRGTWNGTPVAIKVVKPARPDSPSEEYRAAEHAAMKQHRREVHRLHVVKNPYIIQYLAVFRDVNPTDLYIVTEYLEGGSLHDSLTKMRARHAFLDESSFLQVARHMACGLCHVHSQNYTHGDMKPQNVLLTDGFYFEEIQPGHVLASLPTQAKVKIADFGLSKRLEGAEKVAFLNSSASTMDFGTGPCGTFLYMSPEAYNGVSQMSDDQAKAADVYAYGLILFELLSGLQTWALEKVRNPIQLHMLVRGGQRPAWGPRKPSIRPEYLSIVEKCWSHNTNDRPTFDAILDDLAILEQQLKDRSSCQHETTQLQHLDDAGSSADPDAQNSDGDTGLVFEDDIGEEGGEGEPQDSYSESTNSCATSGSLNASIDALTNEQNYPAIRKVISKMLTKSQVKTAKAASGAMLANGGAGEGGGYEEEDVTNFRLPLHRIEEEEDIIEEMHNGHIPNVDIEMDPTRLPAGIDGSVIGGVPVMRVQSVNVVPPPIEPLNIIEDGQRATMGTGSCVEQPGITSSEKGRPTDELLQSMLGISLEPQHVAASNNTGPMQNQPPVIVPPDYVHPLVHDNPVMSLTIRESPPAYPIPLGVMRVKTEDPPPSAFAGVANPSNLSLGPEGFAPGLPAVSDMHQTPLLGELPRRSFSSPEEVDTVALAELSENDFLSNPPTFFTPVTSQATSANTLPASAPPRHRFPDAVRRVSSMSKHPAYFGMGYANGPASVNGPHMTAGPHYPNHPNYSPLTTATNPGYPHTVLTRTAIVTPGVLSPAPSRPEIGKNMSPPDWQRPHYATIDSMSLPWMSLKSSVLSNSEIDPNAVLVALQRPDAQDHLRRLWERGHKKTVAAGVAQAQSLGGTEMLELISHFLQRTQDRLEPVIARDLCVCLGNIARNPSQPLDPDVVLMAVRNALSTMFTHHTTFMQNDGRGVAVYVASNFALSNLLRVNNVIKEPTLRSHIAEWICFSIAWNVREGPARGPFSETLGYAATCAARNFIWMNEDNLAEFAHRSGPEGVRTTCQLLWSMIYFDWIGSASVVETSLSALAMVIHFPKQRVHFISNHGMDRLMKVLDRLKGSPKNLRLIFSMVALLFSEPETHADEKDTMRDKFLEDKGCDRLVAALDHLLQSLSGTKPIMSVLEAGCSALLSIARFCVEFRVQIVNSSAGRSLIGMGNWLLSVQTCPNNERMSLRLGLVLCDLVQELVKEPKAACSLEENGVVPLLRKLQIKYGDDDEFAQLCQGSLKKFPTAAS